MDFPTLFLIALALALDAFAVALAAGISLCQVSFRQTFRLAWHFGLFQGGMNLLGWLGGMTVQRFIAPIDHWLAFGLLAIIGGHMIYEAWGVAEEVKARHDPTKGSRLVLLSVATSIDALAVGLSFAALDMAIIWPASLIGLVALVVTVIGLRLGCYLGSASRLGARAEVLGGLVLIAIGLRILVDHGVFLNP